MAELCIDYVIRKNTSDPADNYFWDLSIELCVKREQWNLVIKMTPLIANDVYFPTRYSIYPDEFIVHCIKSKPFRCNIHNFFNTAVQRNDERQIRLIHDTMNKSRMLDPLNNWLRFDRLMILSHDDTIMKPETMKTILDLGCKHINEWMDHAFYVPQQLPAVSVAMNHQERIYLESHSLCWMVANHQLDQLKQQGAVQLCHFPTLLYLAVKYDACSCLAFLLEQFCIQRQTVRYFTEDHVLHTGPVDLFWDAMTNDKIDCARVIYDHCVKGGYHELWTSGVHGSCQHLNMFHQWCCETYQKTDDRFYLFKPDLVPRQFYNSAEHIRSCKWQVSEIHANIVSVFNQTTALFHSFEWMPNDLWNIVCDYIPWCTQPDTISFARYSDIEF